MRSALTGLSRGVDAAISLWGIAMVGAVVAALVVSFFLAWWAGLALLVIPAVWGLLYLGGD